MDRYSENIKFHQHRTDVDLSCSSFASGRQKIENVQVSVKKVSVIRDTNKIKMYRSIHARQSNITLADSAGSRYGEKNVNSPNNDMQ